MEAAPRCPSKGRLQMLAVKGVPQANLAATQPERATYNVTLGRHRRPGADVPLHPGPARPHHQRHGAQPRRQPGPGAGGGVVLAAGGRHLRPGHRLLHSTQGGGPAEPGPSDTVQGFGNGFGQVWAYDTSSGRLRAGVPVAGPEVLDFPDNVTASKRGTLILCEDSIDDNFVRGLSPAGGCRTSPSTGWSAARGDPGSATSSPAPPSAPTATPCSSTSRRAGA